MHVQIEHLVLSAIASALAGAFIVWICNSGPKSLFQKLSIAYIQEYLTWKVTAHKLQPGDSLLVQVNANKITDNQFTLAHNIMQSFANYFAPHQIKIQMIIHGDAFNVQRLEGMITDIEFHPDVVAEDSAPIKFPPGSEGGLIN